MSDNPEEFLTGSLDDYLLAVADSVHQAQLKLSRMKIPAQPGQPSITYQLPRLDFELKMSFEVAQKSGPESGPGGLVLNARPVSAQNSSRNGTAEAASIIKGSFIAVPLDGGKPPSVIRTSLHRISARALEISVLVQSATGENLSGVEVQFNIDLERSRALNQLEGVTEPPVEGTTPQPYPLKPGTFLAYGKVTTLTDGRAVNTLTVDSAEVVGAYIVIIIDVSGETQTIVFRVEK